jgi:hypothetical protein
MSPDKDESARLRSLLLSLPVRTLCGLRGWLLPSDYAFC